MDCISTKGKNMTSQVMQDDEPVARTMTGTEVDELCLMIQQCLVQARVSINDGLEIHARMMLSVLLTLNKMDREKAALDAEKIMGKMVENLRSPQLDAQVKAQGGIILQ